MRPESGAAQTVTSDPSSPSTWVGDPRHEPYARDDSAPERVPGSNVEAVDSNTDRKTVPTVDHVRAGTSGCLYSATCRILGNGRDHSPVHEHVTTRHE